MAREFKAVPAERRAVPLLIGVAGPPGAGKTFSALVLADGIRSHRGGPVVVIDTERNRSLAYAPPHGVKADGVNHFEFLHVPFVPPFGSLDFLDAVMQQRVHKPSCIIVDSLSDEHEGDGGMLDFHDKELDRMAGDDWAKRERVGQAAWIKPKAKRLEMMNGLFQIMTPLIFCFRAREKTKQIANDRGKQVPTNIGWTPIAPPEIVHNMSLFALLPVKSDGVPMWKGNTAYEDFSIKLPRQFAGMFPEGKRIDASMGKAMSIWALGDQKIEQVVDPKPAKAAAGPATRTEAAKSASEPSTEKAAGSSATGADTGQARTADRAAEGPADGREQDDGFPGDRPRDQPQEAAERPQEMAGAQSAAEQPDLLDSAISASTPSLPETSSQQPVDEPTDDGSKDQLNGPLSDEPAPEEDADGFGAFAATCAGAKDWPTIKAGLLALSRTQAWAEAAPLMHQKVRAMAFHRLQETVKAGYKFDFIRDPHAYRCSIEFFQDEDVLAGNRTTVVGMDWWMPLSTEAKEKFDLAFHTRIRALRETREFA